MTCIPKVRPDAQGTQWQRKLTAAAYWSDGWELRRLDWLRWHGLWPPRSLSATTEGMMGTMRMAVFNRLMLRVNQVLAVVMWAVFLWGLPRLHDWTIMLVPLLFTAAVAMQLLLHRRNYPQPGRPAPDYALIAAMEREVYGRAFPHDGAPVMITERDEVTRAALYGRPAKGCSHNPGGFIAVCTPERPEPLYRLCPRCGERR